jgi:hypothetical protein
LSATKTFTVTVRDTTPPALTLPADITIRANSNVNGAIGAIVNYLAPGALDLVDLTDVVTCSMPSGSTFALTTAPFSVTTTRTTTVTCSATDSAGNKAIGTFRVTVYDDPPACGTATPSPSILWPPDHKMVAIAINGVTDPDPGANVKLTVTSIWQDEPVLSSSNGSVIPDAAGIGTAAPSVRAERAGDPKLPGDGRVYHIFFSADDGFGGVCNGEVKVGVPHDQSAGGSTPVDQGPLYNSVTGAKR